MKRNGFLYVLIWTLFILLIAGLTFGVYTLLNREEDPDDDRSSIQRSRDYGSF
jgi:hypothetical protein